jgi:hypothetical protein
VINRWLGSEDNVQFAGLCGDPVSDRMSVVEDIHLRRGENAGHPN